MVVSLTETIVQKTSNRENERSEVQSTKDKVFDEVNRETGGWAMTMREAKEPVRDGQVENEQQYT